MTKLSRDNSGLNFVTSSKKVNVGEGHCLLTTNRKSTNLLQKTVNVVSKMGRVKKSATDRVPAGTKNLSELSIFFVLMSSFFSIIWNWQLFFICFQTIIDIRRLDQNYAFIFFNLCLIYICSTNCFWSSNIIIIKLFIWSIYILKYLIFSLQIFNVMV